MLTIEKLREYGADTEDGLKRCMDMEEFYLSLVQTVLDDSQFSSMESSIADGDLRAAFEHAHALKGIYANLSLTPLLTPVSKITELLRSETETDYTALLKEAREQLDKLKRIDE